MTSREAEQGFPIVSAQFFTLLSKDKYIRKLQAQPTRDHLHQALENQWF